MCFIPIVGIIRDRHHDVVGMVLVPFPDEDRIVCEGTSHLKADNFIPNHVIQREMQPWQPSMGLFCQPAFCVSPHC